MVTLEQVKLLETKVAKALDFVSQVTGENTLLKEKLDAYQRRIDELEVLIQRFKEDQGRIEEGIISALNRLNQFEDAVEKSLLPIQNRAELAPGKTKTEKKDDSNQEAKVPVESPAGKESDERTVKADFPGEGCLSEPPEDEPLLPEAESGKGLFELETEISEPPGAGEATDTDPQTDIAELDIF